MTEVVHADIFFFVTTVCVVLLTVGLLVVLWLIAKTVGEARLLIREARDAVEAPVRAAGRFVSKLSSWLRHDL